MLTVKALHVFAYGIYNYWVSSVEFNLNKLKEEQTKEYKTEDITFDNFSGVFIATSIGMFSAIITLIIEVTFLPNNLINAFQLLSLKLIMFVQQHINM